MFAKKNDSDDDVFEDAMEVVSPIAGNGKETTFQSESSTSDSSVPEPRPIKAKSNTSPTATTDADDDEDHFLDPSTEDIDKSMTNLGLDHVGSDYPDAAMAAKSMDADLIELKKIVGIFLNSQFKESEELIREKYKKSLYYTHGYATLMTIKAFMTFDPTDIKNALALQLSTVEMTNFYRKKDGILGNIAGMVKGRPVDNMTRLQRHAELIYAESYILKALLTIVNDESFLSFVREGMNIRNSYLILKHCYKWMNKLYCKDGSDKHAFVHTTEAHTQPSLPEGLDADFASGVCFGIGIFNLMLSLLPERILKVFEVIGFSASRSLALDLLKHPMMPLGLRGFLGDLTLLVYNTVLPMLISSVEKDKPFTDKLVADKLKAYPNGAFSLFFYGRNLHGDGQVAEAIPWYQKSISSQTDWQQLHHICHWESAHCYTISLKFHEATKCMEVLSRESRWSKAIYYYLVAAYTYTALELKEIQENGEYTYENIAKLMDSITGRMQRIAGKRIPLEKFVARKSRKFTGQGNRLFLPGFETMMIWNGYSIMAMDKKQQVLHIVSERIQAMEAEEEAKRPENYYDDLVLAYLIKAVVQREMNEPLESMDTFFHVLSMEKQLTLDHYLAPFTRYELGRLYMKTNPPMFKEAKQEFESARRDYKKYSLEATVHFRIHNAIRRIHELEMGTSQDDISRAKVTE